MADRHPRNERVTAIRSTRCRPTIGWISAPATARSSRESSSGSRHRPPPECTEPWTAMVSGPKRPWPPRWSSPPSKAASSSACRWLPDARRCTAAWSRNRRRRHRGELAGRAPGGGREFGDSGVLASGSEGRHGGRRPRSQHGTYRLDPPRTGSTAQRSVRPSAPLRPWHRTRRRRPRPPARHLPGECIGRMVRHIGRAPDRRGRRATRDAQRHERRSPGDTPARTPQTTHFGRRENPQGDA